MRPDSDLTTTSPDPAATEHPEPPLPAPRSRRAVLAAALGGLAATIAGGLARPPAADAAAGASLIIGSSTNNAGTSNTVLTTSSSVVAFELIQNGPGTALMGYVTPSSGSTRGVYGRTDSPNGFGVQARNAGAAGFGAAIQAFGGNNTGIDVSTNHAGAMAIRATTTNEGGGGSAVIRAFGTANSGVWGSSSSAYGVYASSVDLAGVYGSSTNNYGVQGNGSGAGVYGSSTGQFGVGVSGLGYGSDGHGIVGSINQDSGNASGVYGSSAGTTSFAGYFEGKVSVTGTLSKGGGSFRIDHPLDPANRILQHSFVESPDMLNIYNGVVTADAAGEATVAMPAWFMALNRDFRYGLTPIGAFAPVFIKAKVAKGRFTIAGAQPGQEVSWQVTGIRRDAWANANRIEVELDKAADQRGRYLHPAAHGKPAAAGIDHPMQQRLAAMRNLDRTAPTPR